MSVETHFTPVIMGMEVPNTLLIHFIRLFHGPYVIRDSFAIEKKGPTPFPTYIYRPRLQTLRWTTSVTCGVIYGV